MTAPTDAEKALAQEAFPNGETVTIIKPGTKTDPFSGETVDDWANPVEVDYPYCAVGMGPGSEAWLVGRDLTQVALTVYLPYAAVDALSTDRARVRGAEYGVYGDAFLWRSPFDPDGPGGVELALKAGEG